MTEFPPGPEHEAAEVETAPEAEPLAEEIAEKYRVDPPEDLEADAHEREAIRARLAESAAEHSTAPEHAPSHHADHDHDGLVGHISEPSGEAGEGHSTMWKLGRMYGSAVETAGRIYRPLRGFFGLIFSWMLDGAKKSAGGSGGDGHGKAAKAPKASAHGGGHDKGHAKH